jgi:hypothetical protein
MNKQGKRHAADAELIQLLICGASAKEAAAQTGIGVRTVFRRLKDPAFKERLEAARSEREQRMADLFSAATVPAAKTLISLLEPTTAPMVRHAASRTILEMNLKVRDIARLESRMDSVEEQVKKLPAAA